MGNEVNKCRLERNSSKILIKITDLIHFLSEICKK